MFPTSIWTWRVKSDEVFHEKELFLTISQELFAEKLRIHSGSDEARRYVRIDF